MSCQFLSAEVIGQGNFELNDLNAIFDQFDEPVILTEVQRPPELFSHIQVVVDEHR